MGGARQTETSEGGLWAIVLAAGKGSRLRSLTTLDGETVPKQFCALRGGTSLLGLALQRAAPLVSEARVRVVVATEHRKWWRRELRHLPLSGAVEQPCDRGTAAGVLLPLSGILRQDPEAMVVVLPADHYVEKEAVLEAAIRQGVALVRADPGRVALLGVTPPEEGDPDFGWIVPSPSQASAGPAMVERFREKPGAAEAALLRAEGGLVNSFLLVARAATLQTLFTVRLPGVAELFRRWEGDGEGLRALYETLASHDFCRDLLEPSIGCLWVVRVPACGWTDLGTPERVGRCLQGGGRPIPPPPACPPPWSGFAPPLDLSLRFTAALAAH